MRSINEIHRVQVPIKELDELKEYTVCIRPIIERKPYFTETEKVLEKTYKFYPDPKKTQELTTYLIHIILLQSR